MARSIDNSDDVIDSRDVIARIEELRDELERVYNEFQEDDTAPEMNFDTWLKGQSGDADAQELAALESLAKEAEGYAADWQHGEALIRDSYFEKYMDEMLEDIGDLPKDLPCYLRIEVDYNALRMDYTQVDFDGVTYWIR